MNYLTKALLICLTVFLVALYLCLKVFDPRFTATLAALELGCGAGVFYSLSSFRKTSIKQMKQMETQAQEMFRDLGNVHIASNPEELASLMNELQNRPKEVTE